MPATIASNNDNHQCFPVASRYFSKYDKIDVILGRFKHKTLANEAKNRKLV